MIITGKSEVLPQHVRAAFDSYHPKVRTTLLTCRDLLYTVANQNPEIGQIEETLKWGQPSYLTRQTRSGSTVRLAPTKTGEEAAIFVNCNTNLVDQFKTHYPDLFSWQGNRALILPENITDLHQEIAHCLALALSYHLRKKGGELVQKRRNPQKNSNHYQ